MKNFFIKPLISFADNIFRYPKKIIYISIIFLIISLSIQSYIWIYGGYNSNDFFAYEHTAKITIENDFNWLLLSPNINSVNLSFPVLIYILIFLYIIIEQWTLTWVALLFINAFIATFFIHKLGLNITKDKLIASYVVLFFVTIRSTGGYHGLLFPLSDVIGSTFIIITLYLLTSEKPRYYLASIMTIITMMTHPFAGASLLLFLIIFLFFRLFFREKIDFLKSYLFVIISTLPGIIYYYFIYSSLQSGSINIIDRGSEAIINTSLKYFTFMEFPFLYGFLHLTFAFLGIILILNLNRDFKKIMINYKKSSLIIWSILILIYTQTFFFINVIPNYRFLLFPIIAIVIFSGIGLKYFMGLLKSDFSKLFFYFLILLFLFISPIFYNIFAMDPVISADQAEILRYIELNTNEDDIIFTIESTSIYFTAVTGRHVGAFVMEPADFDKTENSFVSLDFGTAKEELLKNDIKYVYLKEEGIGALFEKIPGVETLYKKNNYYFFELSI